LAHGRRTAHPPEARGLEVPAVARERDIHLRAVPKIAGAVSKIGQCLKCLKLKDGFVLARNPLLMYEEGFYCQIFAKFKVDLSNNHANC
jgi:hypothetical protein